MNKFILTNTKAFVIRKPLQNDHDGTCALYRIISPYRLFCIIDLLSNNFSVPYLMVGGMDIVKTHMMYVYSVDRRKKGGNIRFGLMDRHFKELMSFPSDGVEIIVTDVVDKKKCTCVSVQPTSDFVTNTEVIEWEIERRKS